MTNKISLLIGILYILLLACEQPAGIAEKTDTEAKAYFDISAYFEAQQKHVAQQKTFVKTITVDGKTERDSLSAIDVEQELRPFASSDINRAAWVGKYEVDSSFNKQQKLSKLHYIAQDADLTIREIVINWIGQQIEQVHIVKTRESLTVDSKQQMTYRPASGYTLFNSQETPATDPFEFKVEVRWGE